MDHGSITVGQVALAEPSLGGVELGLQLVLELQEEEPLEDLPEDTDNGDRAEVIDIPSLADVLAKEVDLGLVPRIQGGPLTEALVVEVAQPGSNSRILNSLEELDVDTVSAAALIGLLQLDLSHDLLPHPGQDILQAMQGGFVE
ncbi:hypothetical protein OIDMADRAFT_62556 [Oidiodendron maius Zn]|uniref:Uncharacterized protein n=1 Tax=Oidiodendron maius (strain Zn) TaxID=913774 RepID=A0A0C3G8C7_OIDMZ|nr:hypothetical protein OIDMADRAFT_62556 [Oidiodendron maius Zn]